MFTIDLDHFHSLSQFCSEWKQTSKISQFSRFLLRSGYQILVIIWNWLKLYNSLPFIKKTLVNQFEFDYFYWRPQFYSEWRQTSKLVNLIQNYWIWRVLLRSMYAILVKISKWLKLFNSVIFIKKTWGNHF